MRNLRIPRETVKHLPLKTFMSRVAPGRRAEPMPEALLFAAVLFTMTAAFML